MACAPDQLGVGNEQGRSFWSRRSLPVVNDMWMVIMVAMVAYHPAVKTLSYLNEVQQAIEHSNIYPVLGISVLMILHSQTLQAEAAGLLGDAYSRRGSRQP